MKKQIKKKLLKGFLLGTLTVCVLGMCAGCGQKTENIENTVTSPTAQEQTGKTGQKSLSWSELTQTGSMDLSYADQFSVTYYGEENYALVIIGEDRKIPGSAGRRAGTGRSPGRYYAPFAAFNEYVPGSYSAMDFSAIWMQWIRSPFPVQTVPAGI